uniref:NADH dehydrogenase subunit 2 n=1 Tax=Metastrongylus pudendotectus TaxID=55275 RepID=D3J838_METPU|nr:NADH dehydrogenase subunit 2 [Metastrongylus pudendotectus]ACX85137.1 NADH dehydrogenase subunit 2 [Metastrongylus pudendotectus]
MYLYFIFFFVMFFSFFVFLVSNVFFWWGVFLMMTLFIVIFNKYSSSYSSIFNYFVFQESLGLVFLLLFFSYFPVLIMMMKIGISPFHFWIFKVINSMFGFSLVWFLTIHKLPFLVVFFQLYYFGLVYLLILGLLICLFQVFFMKGFKSLLVISSVESMNWLILGLVISVFNVIFLMFYYLLIMLMILFKFNLVNGLDFDVSWELVLVFLNVPFSMGFFLKIFTLMEFLKNYGFLLLLVFFLMFFSVISFSFWFIGLSTKFLKYFKNSKIFLFYFFPLSMVIII